LSGNYILVNDIDASETRSFDDAKGFLPIGGESRSNLNYDNYRYIFRGTLDGGGHTISGLYINRPDENLVGLFGEVKSDESIIKDLRLTNVDIIGRNYVGGLAGKNWGQIENIQVTGSVEGNYSTGGMIGKSEGRYKYIQFCSANVQVNGIKNVGGFIGDYDFGEEVIYCNSTGEVHGEEYVGGFVGYNDGYIKYCFSECKVYGKDNVGGFVGFNRGQVFECYSTVNVKGNTIVGGFFGYNQDQGSTKMCMSSGSVEGDQYVGGFVGICGGDLFCCYSTGHVKGNNEAGRFCGRKLHNIKFEECTATGKVNGDEGPYNGVTIRGIDNEHEKETIASWSYWPMFKGLFILIALEIIGAVILVVLRRKNMKNEKKAAVDSSKEENVNDRKPKKMEYQRMNVRGLR
jgi:hypothetical protein